ncbi:MAG: hypothetical protein JWM68_5492 [Verrucomicrobiales bacterium]|nr:hypothetical protein [Verrucomicrobiales bacterium]
MGAISFSLDERLLAVLTRELPLQLFVETGTFQGDTLALARKFFKKCHSVEMSPQLHEKAVRRFTGDTGVEIHLSDSPGALRKLRDQFASTPTLFWLDAHWCVADDTSGADSQTPLIEEIQAIHKLHPDSVVLIDDARLYLCAPPAPHRVSDWPELDEVARALFALSNDHRLVVYNDVFIFYPKRLLSVMRQFSHDTGEDWLMLVHEARAERNRQAQRRNKKKWWRRLFKK